jgi:hypothetical protein
MSERNDLSRPGRTSSRRHGQKRFLLTGAHDTRPAVGRTNHLAHGCSSKSLAFLLDSHSFLSRGNRMRPCFARAAAVFGRFPYCRSSPETAPSRARQPRCPQERRYVRTWSRQPHTGPRSSVGRPPVSWSAVTTIRVSAGYYKHRGLQVVLSTIGVECSGWHSEFKMCKGAE